MTLLCTHLQCMLGFGVIRLFPVSNLHLPHNTIFCLYVFVCVCVLHRGLDLVNIHLFHDASNLIACNSSPSIYSANRKNALRYVINRSDLQLHTTMKKTTIKCTIWQQVHPELKQTTKKRLFEDPLLDWRTSMSGESWLISESLSYLIQTGHFRWVWMEQ